VSLRALVFAAVMCGCVWGPRPQLPGRDEDGGRTGGMAFADAASADAATMPPTNAPDSAVWGDAVDASRDVVADRGCVEGDAGDAGDAGDVTDAGDAGDASDAADGGDALPPCLGEGAAAQRPIGVEPTP
jgi:hypothetical protein